MDPFRNLDWTETRLQLSRYATSAGAKEFLSEITTLASAELATQQFKEVQEARNILHGGIRPFMESLDLYSLWYERLKRSAVLKTIELKDIRKFCLEAIAFKELLATYTGNWAKSANSRLMEAVQPLSAIDQLMTADGDIRNDASETLFRLYRDKLEIERQIRVALEKLVKSNEMENILQDKFVTNREGRWVLPVKSGKQHDIDGIIHDASQTKQTVYMEPEVVVQLNNQLRQINIRIDEEIERLLKQISYYLSTLISDFERTRGILFEADVRFAQAQLAIQINGEVPEFSDDEVHIEDLRHPLLMLHRGESDVVANTVELKKGRSILLLSGPNAGGKTVLLKAIGLAAHMARCGLLIASNGKSKLPFFKTIFTAVGDAQSVDEHLSTFAAHLKGLTDATKAQGSDSLILVDEICGSTDPEEGSALARSFIEHYSKNGAFGVITSHLGPLKENWPQDGGVVTGSMDFNEDMARPTYMLIMGVYGRSMALKTARKVGVPAAIVDRALELVSPAARTRELKLAELETHKQDIIHLREKLQAETKQATDVRSKYSDLLEKFKKERDEWMKKVVAKAEEQLELLMAELKSTSSPQKLHEDFRAKLPQIVKTSAKARISTPEEFTRAYPPGSIVFVPSVRQDGVIQGTPNNKGEVPVLSQSMRLTLHWTLLQPPTGPANPTAHLAKRSGVSSTTFSPQDDRVIDLRGQTVEEAIETLEASLDRATQNRESRVKIIHGHGTDALKRAVRSFLSRSVYVQKWQAGSAETGGDGITWADIAG